MNWKLFRFNNRSDFKNIGYSYIDWYIFITTYVHLGTFGKNQDDRYKTSLLAYRSQVPTLHDYTILIDSIEYPSMVGGL